MLTKAIKLLENSTRKQTRHAYVDEDGAACALGAIALGSGKYYRVKNTLRRKGKNPDDFEPATILMDVGVDKRYASNIAEKIVKWNDHYRLNRHQIAQMLKWRK